MRHPIRDTAALFEAGLAIVPCCAPTAGGGCSASWHAHEGKNRKSIGKRPLVKGYPDLAGASSPDEGLAHFKRFGNANTGTVIRNGYAVAEADSPEGQRELERLLGAAVKTPTREARGGRGRGYVLLLPSASAFSRSTRRGESGAIDLLVPGNVFIVPPSVNRDGHRYEWVDGRGPANVPPAPMPEPLRVLLRNRAPPSRHTAPSRRATPPSLSEALARALKLDRHLDATWIGERVFGRDHSRSGEDHSFAMRALRLGLRHEEVVAALMVRPRAHRHDEEYAAATVASAARIVREARWARR